MLLSLSVSFEISNTHSIKLIQVFNKSIKISLSIYWQYFEQIWKSPRKNCCSSPVGFNVFNVSNAFSIIDILHFYSSHKNRLHTMGFFNFRWQIVDSENRISFSFSSDLVWSNTFKRTTYIGIYKHAKEMLNRTSGYQQKCRFI